MCVEYIANFGYPLREEVSCVFTCFAGTQLIESRIQTFFHHFGLQLSSVLSLLVFIVTVSCEDEDNDFGVVDFIHKAVFLRNMTAPLIGTIAT